ncbi:intraflagellar transport protein 88 homolog isoform 2-T2 [Morus bassanus]
MMQNVHLAPEADEDDLYSGFNDYNPTFDTEDLENDVAFQQAARTSHGRRPSVTAKIPGTSASRPLATGFGDGVARPMTAVHAAGYTKAAMRGSSFDPLGQARGPAPPLEMKNSDSSEEKIRQLEKKVNELVEESCIANSCGDLKLALEKAKEAGRKERVLVRQREQIATPENINLDLTYSVLFNLASQYAANEMYAEALNTYQVIVKNKMFSNGGRLKVNMGNIYLKQRNYSKAIKFYRMALDQIPSVHKEMSEQMKKAFQKLIAVPLEVDYDDKYISPNDDPHTNLLIEAIKNDSLRQIERERKSMAEEYIMTAAKLIAPVIETSFAVGYDWCVEVVKASHYVELANDLEINKATTYLRQQEFNQALETLKMFEKKDSRVKSAAATNLSFLYYLENELAQATNYADLAVNSDRYNPAALTNKGNTVFANGDYEKAAEFYKEALRNDSSCTEALYNLGLAYKKLNRIDEALDCFLKLHAILRNSAQVLHQIASIYEVMEDPNQAIEWLLQLISVVPTDPHVLSKIGKLYDNEGDKSQAFHYYYESYRYFPSNIEVIEWLGAYYIDTQFCEKAIEYFERAALILPTQVKWQLMVASCYRRSGNYQKALEKYKVIHRKFPENVECLRFLVRLCTDMGLKEVQEYMTKLKKVEKLKEIREQRIKSGRDGSARSRREGNAGGDASYIDPLGPQAERPKTAARKRTEEDDFADEELGEDLLPE